MLPELIELTKKHIDEAVWLIWAFAQRASAEVKIDASIESVRFLCHFICSRLTFPKSRQEE